MLGSCSWAKFSRESFNHRRKHYGYEEEGREKGRQEEEITFARGLRASLIFVQTTGPPQTFCGGPFLFLWMTLELIVASPVGRLRRQRRHLQQVRRSEVEEA